MHLSSQELLGHLQDSSVHLGTQFVNAVKKFQHSVNVEAI